ncbi:MAG: hypothetical protein ACJA2S_005182 [Cyclobacteriaceae bacterium]|jgi:hypothetical protein
MKLITNNTRRVNNYDFFTNEFNTEYSLGGMIIPNPHDILKL